MKICSREERKGNEGKREGKKKIGKEEVKLQHQITRVGEDVEKSKFSYTASGNVKWCSHFGKQSGNFSDD